VKTWNHVRRFSALDAYFHSGVDAPDEAFDLIFCLDAGDWVALRTVWSERPVGWRRECAYVVGHGPARECLPLLERMMFDEDADVALEAAASLAAQRLDTAESAMADDVQRRFTALATRPEAKAIPEVQRFLRLIGGM
jgi:hypothetical protein